MIERMLVREMNDIQKSAMLRTLNQSRHHRKQSRAVFALQIAYVEAPESCKDARCIRPYISRNENSLVSLTVSRRFLQRFLLQCHKRRTF
jgi:hypothetical protein